VTLYGTGDFYVTNSGASVVDARPERICRQCLGPGMFAVAGSIQQGLTQTGWSNASFGATR
jgi:hypothetical protein